MKIAIDVTRAVIETAGIGRFIYEITHSLLDFDKTNEYLIFSTHFNDSERKTLAFESFSRKNVKLKRLKIPGDLKERLWGLKINFLSNFLEKPDVLYAPSFFEVLLGSNIRQVVTIHDMTVDLFPDQRGRKLSSFLSKRTRDACNKARYITCDSISTQKDLIRLAKIDKNKTSVIYPGLKKFSKVNENLPENLKKNSYILSVGTIEPRKNIARLLRAYNDLGEKLKQKYPLVLVGGKGWNDSEIFREANNSGLKKYIKFTGFVDDSSLAGLYKNAKVFVYPSLYEGFGLPVLEALSFGCPVITSNVSSLPEVAGDSALTVSPDSQEEITRAMHSLLTDNALAARVSKNAVQQASKFSFDDSAQALLEVLKNAAQ